MYLFCRSVGNGQATSVIDYHGTAILGGRRLVPALKTPRHERSAYSYMYEYFFVQWLGTVLDYTRTYGQPTVNTRLLYFWIASRARIPPIQSAIEA